jgi:glycosyltransferase involved in cell wall biosynthesis
MVYFQQILGTNTMQNCAVIPSFNESKTIGSLVSKIKDKGFDVIVINDGSTDQTSQIAKKEGAIVIDHEKNVGKGSSLRDGLEYAAKNNYDIVITMDGDGQHDPKEISKFLERAMNTDSPLIIGNRMGQVKSMPFVRKLTNWLMSFLLSKMIKQRVPDTQCGYRLLKKSLLKKLTLETRKFEIESEMILETARMGYSIESVPIATIYSGQKSKIRPFRDTIRFIRYITERKT